jgi:alpha-N-acetylglucosamine transferase
MENLVLQVDIPGKEGNGLLHRNNQLYLYSKKKAKEYANKVNAEYRVISSNTMPEYGPEVSKFKLFTTEYKEYDNILYIDSDLILYS